MTLPIFNFTKKIEGKKVNFVRIVNYFGYWFELEGESWGGWIKEDWEDEIKVDQSSCVKCTDWEKVNIGERHCSACHDDYKDMGIQEQMELEKDEVVHDCKAMPHVTDEREKSIWRDLEEQVRETIRDIKHAKPQRKSRK